MTMIKLSGLLIGFLFGFVLERGYFCQWSGFVDATVFKNYRVLKATIWALLVALIGFHVMSALGLIQLNPKPLLLAGDIVGGIIFGLGMAIAGGCMVGATFKAGTGLINFFIACIGIAVGAFIADKGFLSSYSKNIQEYGKIMIDGKNPTIASWLGINQWFIVAVIAIFFIWLLIKLNEKNGETKNEEKVSVIKRIFLKRWGAALTGISIGIIQAIAFYYSSAAGKKYAISLREGYSLIPQSLFKWDFSIVSWGYLLIPGVILGSAVAAYFAGEFKLRMPKLKQILIMPAGGILMGVGATIAGGCNVGHLLSGVPQLSLGSFLNSIAIFGALYIIVFLRFIKKS